MASWPTRYTDNNLFAKMIERSVSNNRSPPEKNQVDPKPINNLRFREKLSFIYFLRIWRHEAGHRVVELWSKKYSTVPSYGYKRIKVYCQFICLVCSSKLWRIYINKVSDLKINYVRLPSFRHGKCHFVTKQSLCRCMTTVLAHQITQTTLKMHPT